MTSFAGLDVSQQETHVCVVAADGAVLFRGRCRTDPEAIHAVLANAASALRRAVLETSALSALGVPVVCTCARQGITVTLGIKVTLH